MTAHPWNRKESTPRAKAPASRQAKPAQLDARLDRRRARLARIGVRSQASVEPRLVDGRRAFLRARDGRRQTACWRGELECRPLPGHGNHRSRASAWHRRATVCARHVQRLGDPDALFVARVLQPDQLPSRHRLGRRAGDDRLRPSPLRVRFARAGTREGAFRSLEPVFRLPDPRVRRRVPTRRSGDTWRLSTGQHAAAVERDRVSADAANAPRPAAAPRETAPRSRSPRSRCGSGT